MKRVLNKEQMRMPSESLNRFLVIDDNKKIGSYSYLACAIICVAADDYRMALRDNNTPLIKEVESFFNSDWFKLLSDVNPLYLIQSLKCEYAEKRCAC